MSTPKDKGSSLPTIEPIQEPIEEPISLDELQLTTDVDIKKLITLKDQNLSLRAKAKLLDSSHETIRRLQDKLDIIQNKSVRFRANRADILAEQGRRILNISMTDTNLKDMSHRDRAVWFGILSDKESRERQVNQAPRTFHISVKEVHIGIKQGELSPDDPFNVKAIKDMSGPLIEVAQEAIEGKQVPPSGEDSTPDNEIIIPEGSKPLKDNDSA